MATWRRSRTRVNDNRVFFILSLRDDDRAILEEIARRIPSAYVYAKPARPPGRPQASIQISSKAGLAHLVRIFDAHPLRAKKARDYAVWRRAVMAKLSGSGGKAHREGAWPASEKIRELHQEIRDARSYEPPPERPVPPKRQLRLFH